MKKTIYYKLRGMKDMGNTLTLLETPTATEASIRRKQPRVVKTAKFRCLAYQDIHGHWRDFYHGQKLDVIAEPAYPSDD